MAAEAHIADKRFTPADLQERVAASAGKNVLLMITDNTHSMLTAKADGDGLVLLRVHHMFLDAPEEVVAALGRWIGGRRLRQDIIQEYIDANTERIRSPDPTTRKAIIRTRGRRHDLEELRLQVNGTYLEGRSVAPVTWGRKITRRARQSVRLGSYDPVENLITISQRLDHRGVPRYMVEYVIFHEMLHEVLGISERADGRRDIHGRTFKLLEQTYPFYEKARAFEDRKWG